MALFLSPVGNPNRGSHAWTALGPCYTLSCCSTPLHIFTLHCIYMRAYLYLYVFIMPFARYLPFSVAWERQLGYCIPKTCTAPMCECFAVTTPTGSLLSHVLLSTTAIHQCSVALSIRAERFKCSPFTHSFGEAFCAETADQRLHLHC